MSNVDLAATRERCFLDKKSKVMRDGREWLMGKDWKARKMELHKRSNGRCERPSILGKACVHGCYGCAEEPHHIIKRSVARDDRLSNLAGLSHACHLAEDSRKVRWSKSN